MKIRTTIYIDEQVIEKVRSRKLNLSRWIEERLDDEYGRTQTFQ